MVIGWWENQIDIGIKLTKFRIKHHEKHGEGANAMQDKERLKKQERHKQVRADKLK